MNFVKIVTEIEEDVTVTDGDADTQTPQGNITLPTGADYILDIGELGDLNYMYWLTEDSFSYNDYLFAGKFQKNGKYYASIWLRAKDSNHVFGRNVTVKVNGKTAKLNSKNLAIGDHSVINFIVEITPAEEVYTILEGANQKLKLSNIKDLTVKADGDITKFTGLKVDDKALDESKYTKEEGSTIVTLKASYLKTLKAGIHKLTFVYNDGEVSTNFTIVDDTTANPSTYDAIYMWVTLLTISAAGLSVSLLKLRKEN